MPDFRFSVTEVIGAPEGTATLPDGRGLQLPNGDIVKPWIVLELNEDRDLTGEEMDGLGLDAGLDFARVVEPVDGH
jgi:hypothetical protein